MQSLLVRRRVKVFLLFGVGISLLPCLFTWHHRLTASESHDFQSVLMTGEVILASVVLAGAVLGDLLLCMLPPARPYRPDLVVLNVFLAFVVFGVGIYFYSEVTAASNMEFYRHGRAALIENAIALAGAIVAGASSVALRTIQELKGIDDALGDGK
ncbi:hypothetical protein [Mycolicibacter sinensis]|uniref:Transmembrane protein n=1 Tax=Mycolicibacter sinensis (strain JDM601) TaxID=875328 RepID=A0A1A2XVQ1_MYCSD|nr:hypothetical protein [Mycolicibacter sinensis]OBI29840.1 hypothetical protein A5710_20820 [Mycolicibacter sinensis]